MEGIQAGAGAQDQRRPLAVLLVDPRPGPVAASGASADGRRWSVQTASTAEEALARLSEGAFDAVIVDMSLPGIDGASFLTLVRVRHPEVLRVVATEPATRAAAFRALPVAHQALNKPYASTDVGMMLASSATVRELRDRDDLGEVVGSIAGIGAQPRTFAELNALLIDGDAPVASIAAVVERDAVIAGRILQVVNSSFFGLSRELSDIRQAVTFLGLGLLRDLVLSAEAFRPFDTARLLPELPLGAVQDHALATGAAARAQLDKEQGAVAWTAALLQDLGQVVLACARTADYRPMVQESLATGRPLHEIERATWGFDHAEVGAHLLAKWGLPHGLIEAVASHHGSAGGPVDPWNSVVCALRTARETADAPDPFDVAREDLPAATG